ncbi:pseudaminic acid cytidylyltransferase [uncultured Idiomarina sp.]|uniref:pseudaminic acid cytidylyltransferase n=1 Tax=Idiomarina sp. TaxID=1874361 RepID=UPI000C90CDDE|nr:pseudaminic acid cytidylyltransferase [Idiomarinaceae bacterium]MEC7643426.1 pseudaminic acid cytidylyltransferase [Pseudomonadota bacterium]
MSVLMVIPARGGSKRIPRKNIKPFAGKPMLQWSVEAAREAQCFNHIVVSTDDDEIAEVARIAGAQVPFMRPSDLADDYTPTIPVIRHAIETYEAEHGHVDYVCCLYATAPFVEADDLAASFAELSHAKVPLDFVVSGTEFSFPIQRAVRINDEGLVEMFMPEHASTRSQDLPKAWHDAGQFYWGKRDAWFSQDSFFTARTRLFPLPSFRVQDIDTPDDWLRAEWMKKAMQKP